MNKNIKSKGFTLIEIIIVLAIIGIMSSLAVVSLSNVTYRKFITETNKFIQVLQTVRDEAVYSDTTIRCGLNEKKIMFCEKYKEGEWVDMDIGKSIDIQLDRSFTIAQIIDPNNTDHNNPAIYFYSHGENPLTHLQVTQATYSAWIDSDLEGNFSVSN